MCDEIGMKTEKLPEVSIIKSVFIPQLNAPAIDLFVKILK
jgi:hypothetical protein